ncbi:MAG: 3-oxoacyl-ACP reductase FabG, partial [Planctomycetota bacterium]|nr:3-oxoacyl-ACP reductase FabG [Planctomycetota bacterium]
MAENEKVAIVTGASRGIGLEITRQLLGMGMTVVAVDIREDLLGEMADKLPGLGEKLDTRVQDVTDSEGFTVVIDAVAEKYRRIDVLVNNAGITRDGLLMRMSDEDWDLVLKVNLTSAFIGTRAVARHMVRRREGVIINMASFSGIEGNRGQANYSSSKAGLIGLTKTTAKELAGKNVRANAIAPGFIATEMTDALPQQAKDIALDLIPLKKMGQPSDVARVVAFLACDD